LCFRTRRYGDGKSCCFRKGSKTAQSQGQKRGAQSTQKSDERNVIASAIFDVCMINFVYSKKQKAAAEKEM
jgi:hypothetical protein